MKEKKQRFCLVPYFTFKHEEPRASWSVTFEAYNILDSPRLEERYVILETHHSFINNSYHISNFFLSEDAMRTAFFAGVKKYVDPIVTPPKPKKIKRRYTVKEILTEMMSWGEHESHFSEFPGHVRSHIFNDFEIPWFLAWKGERIYKDLVLRKPK